MFSNHDTSDKELIVAIPYLSNDNANGIELVTRELNTDGAVEVSRSLDSDSDFDPVMTPYLEGYYIFNISGILRNPDFEFNKFRTVGALIISGSTLFALFNITLKCFGLNFGPLSADDSDSDRYHGTHIGFRGDL